jgi:hypothetical protein
MGDIAKAQPLGDSHGEDVKLDENVIAGMSVAGLELGSSIDKS